MEEQKPPTTESSSAPVISLPKVLMGIGFIRTFYNQVQLTWKLIQDPRVPRYLKAIPIIAIAYVISPIDLIPDFIPILGQLDDAAVVGLGLNLFLRLAPADIVEEYRQALLEKA